MYGSGSLTAGSNGRSDQVVDVLSGMSTGYLRFSGNHSRADDYRDGDGRKVPSRWRKWNADAAIGWTPDPMTRLELSLGNGDGDARYAGRSMDGSQFRRDSVGVDFSRKFEGGALQSVEVTAYDQHADHVMDNYTLRTPDPHSSMPEPMASNVDRRTQGGRTSATWAQSFWQLIAGVDTQSSRHRSRMGHGRDTWQQQPRVADAQLRNTGAFAELVLGADSKQRWVAGVRLDQARVRDLREGDGGGHAHAHGVKVAQFEHPHHDDDVGKRRREILWSGFLRHERDAQHWPLSFFAGIGHVERMPDYWELFSPNQGPPGSANAFNGVAVEKTTQLDMGMQYETRRIQAWVSAYAGRIGDFVLIRYHGNTSQAVSVDALIHGAEAGARRQLAGNWSVAGSVAWAWGANRSDSRPLPQMPPLEGQVSLDYVNGPWSAGALLRGASGQRRHADGDGNIVGRDIGPSAGFGVFSINGAYRISPTVQLTFGVDNLFDRAYAEHLNLAGNAGFGYPADPLRINEPGRQSWLRLAVTL